MTESGWISTKASVRLSWLLDIGGPPFLSKSWSSRSAVHFTSVTKKKYRPPLPQAPDDDAVRLYQQRDEDFKDHFMLEWMREVAAFRVRGDTVVTVRRRKGVVAIAVDNINVSKGEYFYQWLLMNLVRAIPQSLTHECAFSVPSDYRWLATALYLAPSWRDDQWLLQHFRMQGDKEEIVQTRVLALAARRQYIIDLLSGRAIHRIVPIVRPLRVTSLDPEQRQFVEETLASLENKRDALRSEDEALYRRLLRANKPRFLTGDRDLARACAARNS